jgi:hypothetical protein
MRPHGDATKSYEKDKCHSADDTEKSPMARLQERERKKQKLPIEQSCTQHVAAANVRTDNHEL